jgi:adenine-specific DNA glycosylase
LWRAGFLLACASQDDYEKMDVIQRNKGKRGKHYIRVTNVRGMTVTRKLPDAWIKAHAELCIEHLKTHSRAPKKVVIQKLLSAVLLATRAENNCVPAEVDDGLMHIGTSYCFNTDKPLCSKCPIQKLCCAGQGARSLITKFAT